MKSAYENFNMIHNPDESKQKKHYTFIQCDIYCRVDKQNYGDYTSKNEKKKHTDSANKY